MSFERLSAWRKSGVGLASVAAPTTPDEARATVRFSLSRMNTDEEIARAAVVTRDVVPRCTK